MPSASIRVRLTAWYGGLLMVTIAVLGGALYLLEARSFLSRVDSMLEFELRETVERLNGGHSTEGTLAAPTAFHEQYLLRVVRPDGTVVEESPGFRGHMVPLAPAALVGSRIHELPRFETIRLGALGWCRMVTQSRGSGEEQRLIQIATSLATYQRELATLRGVLWTILPGGLLLATICGYWLAGRVLAPVERMAEAARRISASNLDERLEVAIPTDELGRLASTLNAMLDRIDRAFVATRRFTADAAHELRTPLASIRAEAEVALMSSRSAEVYQETLLSIVEETARLAKLVDRLLLLSADDAGASPARQLIPLDQLVQASADHCAEALARSGIHLHLEGLDGLQTPGDPELLRQVFDNLLDNAIKYTPRGGQVSVHAVVKHEQILIEVRDTGEGIPSEALPRVFDRFFRADPSRSRRTGGTGLGLSIAKSIVESHGGSIDVQSTLDAGSTFRLILFSV